jgi:capsular polysaccharide biosynthesis protein
MPEPKGAIPRGIFLNGHYQFNYFHWICEYLILLGYLGEQDAYADWPLLISEEALAHPNHIDALKQAAGSRPRSVITLAKDVAYQVDELILLPKVTRVTLCHLRVESHPDDYGFAPDAVRRLHAALALQGGRRQKRIFLGRKKNDRLQNQAEIEAEFEKAGFEIVYPEALNFQEARQLFSNVDVLAGPTGAAFTNLILCPPGTTAIVMTTTHGSRAGFFSGLAAPLEQRVIYLHGPGTDLNQKIGRASCRERVS